MSNLQALDKTYIANTYARFPVDLVGGKGSLLKAADGREYIDMGSGIAVNGFGVADDLWLKAVTEQLGKIPHTSNLYYTQPGAQLAEMLCQRTHRVTDIFGMQDQMLLRDHGVVQLGRSFKCQHSLFLLFVVKSAGRIQFRRIAEHLIVRKKLRFMKFRHFPARRMAACPEKE